jgi:hypothetical protein
MQVRELKVKDVFAITRMLSKVKLPQRTGDDQAYGIAILLAALRDASDDIMAWMADMVQIKPEEFAELPAVTIIDVVEGIAGQAGAKDFFARLFKRLDTYLGKLSVSDTAGQTSTSEPLASSDMANSPEKS